MLCFAYGSNMSSQRLAARIPARFVTTALLPAYRLAFISKAGTALASAILYRHPISRRSTALSGKSLRTIN